MRLLLSLAACLVAAVSCQNPPAVDPPSGGDEPVKPTVPPKAIVVSASVDGVTVREGGSLGGVSLEPVISLMFSREVTAEGASSSSVIFSGGDVTAELDESDHSVLRLKPVGPLKGFSPYRFELTEGECFGVRVQKSYGFTFTTEYDRADKFSRISDDELLTLVQRQTFKFFWDYAHPVSGLARERLGSGDTVASGGSGFGLMTFPVAVERGFVSRDDAAARLRIIVDFLQNKAQRFHGAYSHWLNGSTGKAIPFSTKDNGADIVETAYLVQGLLTVAQYFDAPGEADIRSAIDAIWRGVEWDWFTRGGQDVLYWHWSPDYGWDMNMPIKGWNECLITYILAASSPTHTVNASVYHKGWAGSGSMRPDYNDPLFFAHYSFLGIDPHGLKDSYGDYWAQNVAHTRRNYEYCVSNPQGHAGYSASCWGLTASDIPGGYSASSPRNDLGVIAPTAALSSIPYTPEESLAALHEFYYVYGDRLWGEYGFHDAFCLDQGWFAPGYISIDQGPIMVMIENYRTGLPWSLLMKDPDISAGLSKLGFSW